MQNTSVWLPLPLRSKVTFDSREKQSPLFTLTDFEMSVWDPKCIQIKKISTAMFQIPPSTTTLVLAIFVHPRKSESFGFQMLQIQT